MSLACERVEWVNPPAALVGAEERGAVADEGEIHGHRRGGLSLSLSGGGLQRRRKGGERGKGVVHSLELGTAIPPAPAIIDASASASASSAAVFSAVSAAAHAVERRSALRHQDAGHSHGVDT